MKGSLASILKKTRENRLKWFDHEERKNGNWKNGVERRRGRGRQKKKGGWMWLRDISDLKTDIVWVDDILDYVKWSLITTTAFAYW